MNVERYFSTHQLSISLPILISPVAICFVRKTSQEDIIVDVVEEDRRLKTDEMGCIVESQVNLSALFRLEISIT